MKLDLRKKEIHYHFLGIGGIGMSALAKVLASKGYSISGSDKNSVKAKDLVKNHAIKVFNEQSAKNLNQLKSKKINIVISTAIQEKNPELLEAKRLELSIYHRSDLLAALIDQQKSIVIAGSHGKTTTSTIISTIFELNKWDPTLIIGGMMPLIKSNAKDGKGDYLIAEGDESDGSLSKFKASIGIITNIDLDHTNYYKNLDSLIDIFTIFKGNCNKVIINYDDKIIHKNFKDTQLVRYSIKETANIDYSFEILKLSSKENLVNYYEKNNFIDSIKISIPGEHNLSNTLAAISTCREVGMSFKEIKQSLNAIKTPNRRFEFIGIWKNKYIYDDYAHHPNEINATIKMCRLILHESNNKSNQLAVIFQPHRYTRTKKFLDEFAKSLSNADIVFLAPIYSSGEEYIKGINIEKLKSVINNHRNNLKVITSKNLEDLVEKIDMNTNEKDLIVTMGAGNINTIWKELRNKNQIKLLESQRK